MGLGIVYDVLTLNEQVNEQNRFAAAELGSYQFI